jgi:guanylate kinase
MTTVYIISAPSGSGKSTLVNELRSHVAGLKFSVSYTTRAPRGSEENGREYFFVSREEFEAMIRNDEFLECADVYGNYYGTARRFLREAEQEGKDRLLDIYVQGAGMQHLRVAARSADSGVASPQSRVRFGPGDLSPVGHGPSGD